MSRLPKIVQLGVLLITFSLEGVVLYVVEDPTVRLYVGLALFLVIAWMFARSEIAEVIGDLPRLFRRRRYPRLRARVEILLQEVCRLHWAAVDRDRGFRSDKEGLADMDAIEERLRELVSEIRLEAGVASDEPDPREPAPDVLESPHEMRDRVVR
jgi:hypothetical protein